MIRVHNPSQLDQLRYFSEGCDGYFDDFYADDPDQKLADSDEEDRYYGRRVVWLGRPGRMVKIDPDYTVGIEGNIFDAAKLSAVADRVASRELVVFDAGYGTVGLVTPDDIGESLDAFSRDEVAIERPLTSGSEAVDEYLLLRARREASVNTRAERAAEELYTRKSGDLGKCVYTVRDGNHRVFGALLGGETSVWIILSDNQYQEVVSWRRDSTSLPRYRYYYDRMVAISEMLE